MTENSLEHNSWPYLEMVLCKDPWTHATQGRTYPLCSTGGVITLYTIFTCIQNLLRNLTAYGLKKKIITRLTINILTFCVHCLCFSCSIEGEYVLVEGDEVSYKICSIPPKHEKVQAVEVTITHLAPGTKHETWSGTVINSWTKLFLLNDFVPLLNLMGEKWC